MGAARRGAGGGAVSEHTEQVALFEWAAWHHARLPALALLFAIPNGGLRARATAARLQAEGVKRGIPDLFLPIPRGGYHGFWIELKYGANKTTPQQDAWLNLLKAEGYAVDVSYGWQEAAHKIVRYLGHEPSEFGL